MTWKNDLYFVYDGITSIEMGLINVNLSSGLLEEQFLADQSIVEEKIRNNDVPYFSRVDRSPFSASFSFAFEDEFDREKINRVANWLGNQPYYKELYFSNDIDKRYFMIYEGNSSLFHNGSSRGYISITMRSISPYTYSPVLTEGVLDLSNNLNVGTEININNKGNLICKPVIEIEKIGNGSVEILNYSQAENNSFKINNLVDKEFVYIDCENENIESNIPLTYHFDDVLGFYTSFTAGMNYMVIKGNCKIKFTYRCAFSSLS